MHGPPLFLNSKSALDWVHEANRNLAISRYYSDFAIVHHSRFCEANRNLVPGSPARTKIRDVTQWSPYKSIPPKNMAASKSDVTSAVLNRYWPRTYIPSHFCHELSICYVTPSIVYACLCHCSCSLMCLALSQGQVNHALVMCLNCMSPHALVYFALSIVACRSQHAMPITALALDLCPSFVAQENCSKNTYPVHCYSICCIPI